MLNKRLIALALAAVAAGIAVYFMAGIVAGYVVYDIFNIRFPMDNLFGLAIMLVSWLFPLVTGMLTTFLIAYWYIRERKEK
jgi:cation transporter-like permease